MRRQVLGCALVLLALTGCTGGKKPATTSTSASQTASTSVSPTPSPSSTSAKPTKVKAVGCSATVAAAAAKLRSGTIRNADVVAAFNACPTMAEFSKAAVNSPGLVDLSSTDALTFVKKACGADPQVRATKLCKAVGATASPTSDGGL